MAITILTPLPSICFAENVPDIIISGVTSAATLSVELDDTSLVNNIVLTPNAQGEITVFAKQMVHMPAVSRPKATSYILKNLIIKVVVDDKSYSTQGAIIPGGVNKKYPIAPEWFPENFLTWQPRIVETTTNHPQWLACAVRSNSARITFRSILYAANGCSYEKEFYFNLDPFYAMYTFCQVSTDFKSLWGEFCEEKNIDPICYDVFGDGYNGGDTTTTTRQSPQRYILRPERSNDICFGFVNTLGGLDTLMMDGKMVLKPEGENTTFVNNGKEYELSNGYTSFWEVSTGNIDTARMAAQFQDFLKSTDRWVFTDSQWLKIIVDEYKVEHTPRELNAYSFKYHMAEKDEQRYYERTDLPEVELPRTF